MKRRLKLLGMTLGVAALLALTLSSIVFADTPEGTTDGAYGGGYGWHGFQGEASVCSETVSELIGLTQEEICDQRAEGKSLVEIAAGQGVSEGELVAAIMAEKTEAVQAGVDDGTLTQEQADLILQQMAERTELAVSRTTTGPVEWRAGGGYGRSGEGAGPGKASRWGAQSGRGACYGDAGLGTETGGMHQWGRGMR